MLLVCLYSQDMISAWLEEFQSDYPKLHPIDILFYGDCSSWKLSRKERTTPLFIIVFWRKLYNLTSKHEIPSRSPCT